MPGLCSGRVMGGLCWGYGRVMLGLREGYDGLRECVRGFTCVHECVRA